jgi:hypothetical protein
MNYSGQAMFQHLSFKTNLSPNLQLLLSNLNPTFRILGQLSDIPFAEII